MENIDKDKRPLGTPAYPKGVPVPATSAASSHQAAEEDARGKVRHLAEERNTNFF